MSPFLEYDRWAAASAARTGATSNAPNADTNERLSEPEACFCDFSPDFVRRACAGFVGDVADDARLVDPCACTRAERLIQRGSGVPARGRVEGERGRGETEIPLDQIRHQILSSEKTLEKAKRIIR